MIGLMIAICLGSVIFFYNHFLCPEKPSLILDEPEKTVEQKRSGDLLVHVCGAVKREGVYRLCAGDRILNAVKAAGGALPAAELSSINLAEEVKDGQRIIVPEKEKQAANIIYKSGKSGKSIAANVPVNINTATEKELDDLPGVGPATAKKIIENRPYSSIEDLSKVERFGKKKIEKLKDRITI